MYKNVGGIIKRCVSICVAIGFVLSALGAFIIICLGLAAKDSTAFLGALFGSGIFLAVGCLAFWLNGLLLYAYGEITEQISDIKTILQQPIPVCVQEADSKSASASQPTNVAPEWISTIYRLPIADLERLLKEKRELFSDAELAMIEDALIQRVKASK